MPSGYVAQVDLEDEVNIPASFPSKVLELYMCVTITNLYTIIISIKEGRNHDLKGRSHHWKQI